jgi:membrane-bound serine protease (ClpP class)
VRSVLPIFAFFSLIPELSSGAPSVLAVDLDGMVHPVTVEITGRAIEQARESGAALILIRLNTPGGLMDAMRQTVEKLVSSPVPVATFVVPSGGRAASAGFFLLEAGDVAAMAPGTNTGAAHPVSLFGEDMNAVMKQKIENDAAASLRSLIARRGRNAGVGEKAVLESKSFTEREALDLKLIDLVARDERDLLAQLDDREITRFDGSKLTLRLSGAAVTPYRRNTRQRVLSAIADPNIALLLLVLGAIAIYVEFSAPGLILPGVAGSVFVVLGLAGLSLLPINWTGAALLLLALALFVLEAKIVSHGILAAGGTIAMVLGAVLLIDGPVPEMRIRLSTALALALPFGLITALLLRLVVRARRLKAATGSSALVGASGAAVTSIAPEGKVSLRGEYWDAVSPRPIGAGARVRVTSVTGLVLTVEAEPPHPSTGD